MQRYGEEAQSAPSLLDGCLSCLDALARCVCCISAEQGEGGQRLLSTSGEPALAIEASASPPPRLPPAMPARSPVKGQGPSSSGSLPAASPPMPPPFFPPPKPKHGGARCSAEASSGSSPEGGSPSAAAAKARRAGGRSSSKASLVGEEDEEVCPTCLDPYTEDNPKVLTRCAHHFHLPCLYEWLERSETCPVCASPMHFEEVV